MSFEWRRRPLFFLAVLLCLVIGLWRLAGFPGAVGPSDISRELQSGRTSAILGGRIVSEIESRDVFPAGQKTYFLLEAEKLWEDTESQGRPARGRVRVSWKNAPGDLGFGDVVVLAGELEAFSGARNPGGFDARSYWENRGLRTAFLVRESAPHKVLSRGGGNPLRRSALAVKRAMSARLESDFDARESAFLKALFLGEKKDLEQDFKDLFFKTGTLHILAVSGFNIGFLGTVLWFFLMPVPAPRNVKLALLMAAAWSYCLLVGWQAPVVRATLMASVFLLGNMLGRKTDGLNALGLAACVILALNPRELFDAGFQLSFLAVFGLITLEPVFVKKERLLPFEKRSLREKCVRAFRELFWVSFICYFFTLPAVVWNFFIVTPYALAANLLVVPLSFLLFLFALPYFILPPLAALLKGVLLALTKSLFVIEALPGSVWTVGRPSLGLVLFLAAGLLFLFYSGRLRTGRARALAAVFFSANLFLVQEIERVLTRRFEMTMLDVGQGDAVYFEFPRGGNLLVDAGSGRFSDQGRWAVMPFLRSKGVRSLDAVVLSHPQEDHVGGLSTVLEEFRVRRVYHAGFEYDSPRWHEILAGIEREGAAVQRLGRGFDLRGYPGVGIRALHPELDGSADRNINNESVVLKLVYGQTAVLLTGDIQEKAIDSLLNSGSDLGADVFKVPHHGAKGGGSARALFWAVQPRFSLVSAGRRNLYGHPAAETLSALEAVPGNRVLRTDERGSIRLVSDGSRIVLDGPSGLAYDSGNKRPNGSP